MYGDVHTCKNPQRPKEGARALGLEVGAVTVPPTVSENRTVQKQHSLLTPSL